MNKTLSWSALAMVAGLSLNVFSEYFTSSTGCLDSAVTAKIFAIDTEWLRPGRGQTFVVTVSGMAHCQPKLWIDTSEFPEGVKATLINQKGSQYISSVNRSEAFEVIADYLISVDGSVPESEIISSIFVREGNAIVASAEVTLRVDKTAPPPIHASELIAHCTVMNNNVEMIRVDFTSGPQQKLEQAPLMNIENLLSGVQEGAYDLNGDYRHYVPHVLIPAKHFGVPMLFTRTDLAGNRSAQSQEMIFSKTTVNGTFSKKLNRCLRDFNDLAAL